MVAIKKDKINGDALGTGRRKSSVARVRVRPGSGKITVNRKGKVITLDYREISQRGDKPFLLQPGDIVNVPERLF